MTDVATVPTEKLRAWLVTGGDLAEGRHQRAAAELLDFAGLLDRREVRAHISTRQITDRDGRPHLIARVDWSTLAAADLGPLGGAQRRLLDLALSLGGGVPVDLRRVVRGELGDAHARAVLAALVRALGLAEADTPASLDRKHAHDQQLAALLGTTTTEPS